MGDVSPYALSPGTHLEEYRIIEVLASGGFGIAYLAYDENLKVNVAIKEYLPMDFAVRGENHKVFATSGDKQEDYEWGLNAFLEEATLLAQFRFHRHIVHVERYFKANGTAYIVMEYVEGVTLTEKIHELECLTEKEVKHIIYPIIEDLNKVHKKGIIHRDIKTDNILIRDDGSAVLIDFGAARQVVAAKSKPLTTILTPGYAPLEQYSSKANNIGPWTDIYSLAAVIIYSLKGGDVSDVLEEASDRVYDDNSKALIKSLKVSAGLKKALTQAYQVAVTDRTQNLDEFLSLLNKSDTKPKATYDELDGLLDMAGRNGVINQNEMDYLIDKAKKLKIPKKKARDYILDYAKKNAWEILEQESTTSVPEAAKRSASKNKAKPEVKKEKVEAPKVKEVSFVRGIIWILVAYFAWGYYQDYRDEQLLIQKESDAWQQVIATNTQEAYDNYLRAWPNGEHSVQAKEARDAIIEEGNSQSIYESLTLRPQESDTQKKEANIEEGNSRSTYESLALPPQQSDTQKKEAKAWKKAQLSNSIDGYEKYLKDWPSGTHVEQAKKAITKLKLQLDIVLQVISQKRVEKANRLYDSFKYAEAYAVYLEEAKKGNAVAMASVAKMLAWGRGVKKDLAKAKQWAQKAIPKLKVRFGGDSFYHLGVIYDVVYQDYLSAKKWYEKAIQKDNAWAMINLGLMYKDAKGVRKNASEAKLLFERAADKGELIAMYNLAILYRDGDGVEQNYWTAKSWLEKAANKGYVDAMVELGWFYAYSDAVFHDYKIAKKWYEKAAAKGNANGMFQLGWFYYNGLGVSSDNYKAKRWFEKAAELNHSLAMKNLAVLYENGQGVTQSDAKAAEWRRRAAAAEN